MTTQASGFTQSAARGGVFVSARQRRSVLREALTEKRRDFRVPFDVAATVGNGTIETTARCVDISRSGMAVRSNLVWPEGSIIRVRLRLATGQSAVIGDQRQRPRKSRPARHGQTAATSVSSLGAAQSGRRS